MGLVSKALKSLGSEEDRCQAWEGLATWWGHVVLVTKPWPTSLVGRTVLTGQRGLVLAQTSLTLPLGQEAG